MEKPYVIEIPKYNPNLLEQDYSTGERFEFSSPEDLVRKYLEIDEGTWVCVSAHGDAFCEGCCDADNIEMFEEYFGRRFDEVVSENERDENMQETNASSLDEQIEQASSRVEEKNEINRSNNLTR